MDPSITTFPAWGPAYARNVLHMGVPEPWCHMVVPPDVKFGVELETVIGQHMRLTCSGPQSAFALNFMGSRPVPKEEMRKSLEFRMTSMGALNWE